MRAYLLAINSQQIDTMQYEQRSIAELVAAHRAGHALDQRFYVDPDLYALEIDRIVMRDWILAGHVSELPEPGDFKILTVANESAIVVRGSNGALKAFANVCRHRGSLVCLERRGNVRKFTCPYHGWTYDIDGDLVAARAMPPEFNKAEYSLRKVSIATVHGLIMISFNSAPPTLDNARRDLAEPMGMFGFENLKVAAYKEYEIAANWKLAVENYQECYHCSTAHPEYAKMHTLTIDERKRQRIQQGMLARMESCGVTDISVDNWVDDAAPGDTVYGYWRTALFEGYKTGSKEGAPVAPLLGNLIDYDGGASDMVIGPLSYFLCYSDHVVCYVFTPVDIGNSRCDIYWLVRSDAVEGKDYAVEQLTWLWDITTESDKEIIVNNSKGVKSRFYTPGPLSGMEHTERSYIEWFLDALQRD